MLALLVIKCWQQSVGFGEEVGQTELEEMETDEQSEDVWVWGFFSRCRTGLGVAARGLKKARMYRTWMHSVYVGEGARCFMRWELDIRPLRLHQSVNTSFLLCIFNGNTSRSWPLTPGGVTQTSAVFFILILPRPSLSYSHYISHSLCLHVFSSATTFISATSYFFPPEGDFCGTSAMSWFMVI